MRHAYGGSFDSLEDDVDERRYMEYLIGVATGVVLAALLVGLWYVTRPPDVLRWGGKVYTSEEQFKEYLEEKGLSYSAWVARHPDSAPWDSDTTPRTETNSKVDPQVIEAVEPARLDGSDTTPRTETNSRVDPQVIEAVEPPRVDGGSSSWTPGRAVVTGAVAGLIAIGLLLIIMAELGGFAPSSRARRRWSGRRGWI